MESNPFYTIEIRDGYFPSLINISPARKLDVSADPEYEQDYEHMISIDWFDYGAFLDVLLNKYYCEEIQMPYFEDSAPYGEFDEFGWTFYTPGQIRSILSELQIFVNVVSDNCFDSRYKKYLMSRNAEQLSEDQRIGHIMQKAPQLTDFYRRLIERMNHMLNNMGEYDYILFVGP